MPVSMEAQAYAKAEAEEAHSELHSLNVAIGANLLIFAAKVYVHILTGSSSLLAEALHSLADVGNQALLRVGVLRSSRAATPLHPYGYTRDRFIWALISAVGIFFLGAGASFIHGVHTLFEARQLESTVWTYAVLAISGLLEGYSLWVATRYVNAGAKARNQNFFEYIRSGANPTTVAVMLEDGGAVLGLVIAAVCTALADLTGNAMFDAGGSILVGCLLGGIATFLVQRNRQLLIGRSMNRREVGAVMALLKRDPVVSLVLDTKTEEIGPSVYRFKAEVAWNGDQVVQRYIDRCGRERLIGQLRSAMDSREPAAIDYFLKDYGRDIISAVGSEVDRIEGEIQRMNPGIKWVDLETDRGRSTSLHMHRPPGAARSSRDDDGDTTGSDSGDAGGRGTAAGTSSSSSSCAGTVLSAPSHCVSNGSCNDATVVCEDRPLVVHGAGEADPWSLPQPQTAPQDELWLDSPLEHQGHHGGRLDLERTPQRV